MRMSLLLTLLAAGLACQGPKVVYGDPGAREVVTADFGSTDLQLVTDKMVASLLDSGRLVPDKAQPDQPPVVAVTSLRNRTSEHIDTKSITDKIRTALLKSGRARFSAMDMQGDLLNQVKFQDLAADTDTAKAYGRQVGATFILGGDITSIVKQSGRVKDVYYKITLNLVHIESGLITWADEKEIRKDSKRPLFGL
jgi:penicillin-binding protein activator